VRSIVPKGVDATAEVPEHITKQLRALLGSANWLSNQSRPDLSVATSLCMQAFPKPTWGTIIQANNLVRRAKLNHDLGLKVSYIAPQDLRVLISSDASQHNAKEDGTQGGYLVFLTSAAVLQGDAGSVTPIVWKSYRLRRAAASTMSSETQACRDGCSHGVYIANMLAEALEPDYHIMRRRDILPRRPMCCVVDCKSLYDSANGNTAASTGGTDKLTSIETTIIRELKKDTGITVRWGPGEVQIADGLTKDKEEPSVQLRGVIRSGRYQLAEAGEVLRNNKREKELKEERKQLNQEKVAEAKAPIPTKPL
jgi:hypothetical protein